MIILMASWLEVVRFGASIVIVLVMKLLIFERRWSSGESIILTALEHL